MKFTIANVSDKPLDLTIIAAPTDVATVTLPKTIAAGQTGEGVIKLKQDALGKEFEEVFTFELSDEAHTRFSVPIKRSLRIPGQPAQPTQTAVPVSGKTVPASGGH